MKGVEILCIQSTLLANLERGDANSQLRASFMDGKGGGSIELNLYQERERERRGNELVGIVWDSERERVE